MTAEHDRLDASKARRADWKKWGPYLAERAWGTVREDYSATGEAWEYFPHDHARSRGYRWNEDGLAGFCDREQHICLGLGLWNEQDPILKERLFGVTGTQGNHGEDVKEYYYYLNSTPTHSYARMLDPDQFLSDYGLRSLSKEHEDDPFTFEADGRPYSVQYEPAESRSGMFGGNSNWRGPVWFPVNYLMIESLQTFDHYYGEDFTVEMPDADEEGSLWDVSANLSRRLIGIFREDDDGNRPVFGGTALFQDDPDWDYPLFYEYFHGDNGAGIGASHQTGWTATVAKLIQQSAESPS